jgi:hypothetical protein
MDAFDMIARCCGNGLYPIQLSAPNGCPYPDIGVPSVPALPLWWAESPNGRKLILMSIKCALAEGPA